MAATAEAAVADQNSNVPDYCEPFVGYRTWGLIQPGIQLFSGPFDGFAVGWPFDEPLVAKCFCAVKDGGRRYESCCQSPSEHGIARTGGCVVYYPCGIYAWRTADPLIEWSKWMRRLSASYFQRFNGFVVGQVSLWGRVVPHEYGYRAEYAYPKTFGAGFDHDLQPMGTEWMQRLADRYGVPYRRMEEFYGHREAVASGTGGTIRVTHPPKARPAYIPYDSGAIPIGPGVGPLGESWHTFLARYRKDMERMISAWKKLDD